MAGDRYARRIRGPSVPAFRRSTTVPQRLRHAECAKQSQFPPFGGEEPGVAMHNVIPDLAKQSQFAAGRWVSTILRTKGYSERHESRV